MEDGNLGNELIPAAADHASARRAAAEAVLSPAPLMRPTHQKATRAPAFLGGEPVDHVKG